MTATTIRVRPSLPVRPTTVVDTLKAEWTKLRTLRSTWLTLGGGMIASVVIAALVCVATVSQWDSLGEKQRADFDPTSTALLGVLFAAAILGSLAVRAITSEYATGMIRVTFSAIPGRRGVLAAKAAILAVLVLPVALVTNVVSYLLGRQILSTKHIPMSLSDPGVVQAILLGALAVSAVAVLGLALGAIIRRTSGATTALLLAIVGSQIIGIALPEGARQYLPGAALQAVVSVRQTAGVLSPGKGLGVLAVYAAFSLGLAARLVAARDA